MKMNKYLLAVALTALAASPALAATHHRSTESQAAANSAYDYTMPGSDAVVSDGQYLGADPDPAIRQELLREGDQSEIGGN
jgi:opacity protein-like surface antigen